MMEMEQQRAVSPDGVIPVVNGEERTVAAGSTLGDLLRELAVNANAVVVEHNREIVRDRSRLDSMVLATGDSVEIVHFVGGG
ncbi:MAG: thiamine biosynthesis protein ThiS [Gemmatimonadetes bacterium]|jgi:thiamine biosynthesis protein ThiS|nr:thiamine biosynthesis protein ThiS [Gemmatimonadota bacterium]